MPQSNGLVKMNDVLAALTRHNFYQKVDSSTVDAVEVPIDKAEQAPAPSSAAVKPLDTGAAVSAAAGEDDPEPSVRRVFALDVIRRFTHKLKERMASKQQQEPQVTMNGDYAPSQQNQAAAKSHSTLRRRRPRWQCRCPMSYRRQRQSRESRRGRNSPHDPRFA